MTHISLDEIKKAACGLNEDGKAKSIVLIALNKININNFDEEPETLMDVSTLDAEVELKTIGEFSYVNLKFPNETHPDFSLFYRCFEMFYDKSDELDSDHALCAFISIIPLELGGEYMINAINPLFWAPQPDALGDITRTLRSVFVPENVQYVYSELTDDEMADLLDNAKNDEHSEINSIYDTIDEAEEDFSNNEFTDDKYSPENNFGIFDIDGDDE